jgi:hypothetical protein
MASVKRFEREILRTERAVSAFVAELELEVSDYVSDQVDDYYEFEDEVRQRFIISNLRRDDAPGAIELILDDLRVVYEQELENVKGRFRLTEEDAEETEEILQSQISIVRKEVLSILSSVATALVASAFAGSIFRIRDAKRDYIAPTFSEMETALTREVAAFRSALEIRKAQAVDGEALYAYIGPRDDKNRPFCRDILNQNRLFTLKEIEKMDNEQLNPVFLYGGGYNCRHRWIYTKRA